MFSQSGLLQAVLALSLLTGAQDDPPMTPLQSALGDVEPKGPWHYNDLASGFAEARSTGKPLLIVFR